MQNNFFSISQNNDKMITIITFLGFKVKLKHKPEAKIVKLMGGLGNQMFQYAFGKTLEKSTGQKTLYDLTYFNQTKTNTTNNKVEIRPYDLDIFNISLTFASDEQINYSKSNSKWIAREKKFFTFDKKNLNKNKFYFKGYFQNEQYFTSIANELKKDFTFPQIDKDDKINNEILSKINNAENPVFIHIRRGDYLNLDGWTLSDDYYKKAIKEILNRIKKPTFFIVGQNCEEYINNELNLECDYEYIGNHNSDQGKDYIDMQLMSQCKHAIIANSTFSWWAAWLINNKHKIVIAPCPWIKNHKDIICKDWVKVENK